MTTLSLIESKAIALTPESALTKAVGEPTEAAFLSEKQAHSTFRYSFLR